MSKRKEGVAVDESRVFSGVLLTVIPAQPLIRRCKTTTKTIHMHQRHTVQGGTIHSRARIKFFEGTSPRGCYIPPVVVVDLLPDASFTYLFFFVLFFGKSSSRPLQAAQKLHSSLQRSRSRHTPLSKTAAL